MAILIVILTILSCSPEKDKSFGNYRLKEKLLYGIQSKLMDVSGIFYADEIPIVYKLDNNVILFHDVEQDKLIKKVTIPIFTKFNSIDIISANHFAYFADSSFFVFKNDVLTEYTLEHFDSTRLVLPYHKIKYFPSLAKISCVTISLLERSPNQLPYDEPCIAIYDLKKQIVSPSKLKYPKIYHDNKLAIPKMYFSKSNKDLLVSFSYSDNIFKVNIETGLVDSISINTTYKSDKAYYDPSKSKAEKLDMLNKNQINASSYGIAFYSEKEKKYFRIFRPGMPIKDGNRYLTSLDAGCWILELNEKNKIAKEYKLPNGVYFLSDGWSYNTVNKSINYLKVYPYDEKIDVWIFNLHSLFLYNF